MEKTVIRCPKCGKMIAKLGKGGSCKKMFLYCRQCKKEYEITIQETKVNLNEIRACEPSD